MTSSRIPTAPADQARPGVRPDAALRVLLDEVASCLRELKWERPATLADAEKVLADLAHTRDRLVRVGRDPRLSAVGDSRDLSTIVNKLALATGGWAPRLIEHDATGQDLARDTAHALAAELPARCHAAGRGARGRRTRQPGRRSDRADRAPAPRDRPADARYLPVPIRGRR
jgi:hypothetical protein